MTFRAGEVKPMMEQMLAFIADGRYLAAFEMYSKFLADLSKPADQLPADPEYHSAVEAALKEHDEVIQKLLVRHKEVMATLHYQDADQEWTLGAHFFGITTYYQYDHTDNSLILKLEGVMEDLPLFEQCCVIYEIDLFPTWMPFCQHGETIDKVGVAELVPYLNISIPPLGRDMVLQAYGADCLLEHGKLLIIGKSIDDYPAKQVPFKPKGWFQDRMSVKEFKTITEVLSPTSAKTVIVADINPNCPLPASLLNFVIRKLAGLVLHWFQKQVIKVSQDHNCEHAHRIRENKDFYSRWLLPRLRGFCDFKDWQQPTILSLGEDGVPAPKECKVAVSAVDEVVMVMEKVVIEGGAGEETVVDDHVTVEIDVIAQEVREGDEM